MNSKPLVSAITIFFNCEKFIEEAIESVLAQTYDNWELLLVDDGSSDGSTAIALQYAQRYPQIRYLEHPNHQNRGMSATRNLGIRNALGEYIAFLDADDVWLPQKLEQQLATMQSQPEADIVFGPTQRWYSWTGNPDDAKRDSLRKINIQPHQLLRPPKLLALLLQGKANTPGTCSVLIRRSIVEKIGGFEEVFRGMYEDQAFFAKVYFKASVYVETKCWDKYRQHPESNCAIAKKTRKFHPYYKLNPAYENYLNWLVKYLSKEEVKDVKIWRSVEIALWPFRYPKLYSLQYPLEKIWNGIKYRLSVTNN
ncbi:family 2 glycosyl transferase [Calothrix sp. NIES-4071]|nr:family 2 glycosyl transferase [Calothrix sp. NIES-4071]BAZ55875.1 family 2 glycosyl transferase [Calothrix sp. NIES-4105]